MRRGARGRSAECFPRGLDRKTESNRRQSKLDRKRAAEEGAEIAERLLTMCIRAIDYCPPTDLQFCDFASALLTAD